MDIDKPNHLNTVDTNGQVQILSKLPEAISRPYTSILSRKNDDSVQEDC